MITLLLSQPFYFLKTFLFLSLFFPTYIASDAEGYTACAPFSCGKFSEISYPFWGNHQPDYCGHPNFKLDCQQDNLTIEIKSQKFLVLDINQINQILKIAKLDLWGNLCPKEYTNVSLDFSFFDYSSSDDNITVLYDCDFPYTPPAYLSPSTIFNCPIDGDLRGACLMPITNFGNWIDLGCKISITVPVLKVAMERLIEDGLVSVIDEGFEVGWSGVDEAQCDSCKQSGGRCGHNASIKEFTCFCHNIQNYGGVCGNIPPARSPRPALLPPSPYLPKISEQHDRATCKYSSFPKFLLEVLFSS